MKVFISWSGERSKKLAQALRDQLPLVLDDIEPWNSADDIDPGERWAQALGHELELHDCGIVCVSRDNLRNDGSGLNSDWLAFEAGALAKSFATGNVIPFLLDLDVDQLSTKSPLHQFQVAECNSRGFCKLVAALHRASEAKRPAPRKDRHLGRSGDGKEAESLADEKERELTERVRSERAQARARLVWPWIAKEVMHQYDAESRPIVKLVTYAVSTKHADARWKIQAGLELRNGVKATIPGEGKGVIAAFLAALEGWLKIDKQGFTVHDYSQYTLGERTDAQASSYVSISMDERPGRLLARRTAARERHGTAVSTDTVTANLHAILCAVSQEGRFRKALREKARELRAEELAAIEAEAEQIRLRKARLRELKAAANGWIHEIEAEANAGKPTSDSATMVATMRQAIRPAKAELKLLRKRIRRVRRGSESNAGSKAGDGYRNGGGNRKALKSLAHQVERTSAKYRHLDKLLDARERASAKAGDEPTAAS